LIIDRIDIIDSVNMIGPSKRQASLFYLSFGIQASLIKDDLLEPIDKLLDDEALIELVSHKLGRRRPQSRRLGRVGIAPDRLLRLAVLKHIKQWSFRDLEREVRSSLVYRRFTRFDEDAVPSFTNISRAMAALGPETVAEIHARVVQIAHSRRIAPGRKLRTDTTVVETNVHHPTDSTLLADGVRVLQRAIKRIAEEAEPATVKVVDHSRSVKRRVMEIHTAARSLTDAGKAKMKASYGRLLSVTGSVVRQAESLGRKLAEGAVKIAGDEKRVLAAAMQLKHFVPLAKRVIDQTKARVFDGNVRFEGKLLSIFETHTAAIRKGKAHKSTEFGRLVRLDEVENGIVSHYCVADGNPADVTGFMPAVSQHVEIFGRAPHLATGDRGFYSAANERDAQAAGVKRVVLPARGPLSKKRKALQRERWFKRGLRWRVGIEPRIATLKHRFDMARVRYKGDAGIKRGVGWSVIAQNLASIARVEKVRASEGSDNANHRRAA
jgi:IS5 family transposase